MQKHLYILCEGELDEMFYERIAERVTGQSFHSDQEFRVRRGSSYDTAIASARLLINRFKGWSEKQPIAVIIAVDNDRAPGHPAGCVYPRPLPKADLKKEPRYTKLVEMLTATLGKDRSQWPIEVALAVPVEMIESWVLTLLQPDREELPLFSEANSHLARQYYPNTPPPQLKDLRDEAAKSRGLNRDELFWQAASEDLEAAAKVSPSLRLFLDDLKAWSQE
ncbi:hypothetical protein GCM10023213_42120 [Prosthecobacter algae]|uniref:DUF4276 family protein n=1 Tax=Prosthecobacter algae TaxID=1144682 RepID=A0ABP9PJ29_9BACT